MGPPSGERVEAAGLEGVMECGCNCEMVLSGAGFMTAKGPRPLRSSLRTARSRRARRGGW